MKFTRDIINVSTMAIIETLAELPDGIGIEGHLYVALMHFGFDLDSYQKLIELLAVSGLVKRIGSHQLRITEKGRLLAADITKIRAEAKAKADATA